MFVVRYIVGEEVEDRREGKDRLKRADARAGAGRKGKERRGKEKREEKRGGSN